CERYLSFATFEVNEVNNVKKELNYHWNERKKTLWTTDIGKNDEARGDTKKNCWKNETKGGKLKEIRKQDIVEMRGVFSYIKSKLLWHSDPAYLYSTFC